MNLYRFGVAPAAKILPIQVYSLTGDARPGKQTIARKADILAALNYLAQPDVRGDYAIAAVNLSLALSGGFTREICISDNSSLEASVSVLHQNGIAVIAGAGNGGGANIMVPACLTDVISVGATTDTDAVADYSDRPSYLDFFAPGGAAGVDQGITTSALGGGYFESLGTSLAAPHVAGAFAVLRDFSEQASVAQLETVLKSTGTPILVTPGFQVPRINVEAARNNMVGKDDFNRDGKDDIVWRHGTTGANSFWFLNGTAVVGGAVATPVSDTNWKLAGTGDFNADTHTDILWHHDVTAQNAVWFMNGPNYSSQTTLASAAVEWKPSGVGDFDGNGTNDVVWRNSVTGENSIWFLNGTTLASGGPITSVTDLTWKLVGAGDINGDGRADLIWWNSSAGSLAGWLMNGLASTSVFIGQVADTSWKASAVADTNGDGRADVIWRNATTGGASVWFLNGSTVTGGGFIGAVSDLQFDVVGAK